METTNAKSENLIEAQTEAVCHEAVDGAKLAEAAVPVAVAEDNPAAEAAASAAPHPKRKVLRRKKAARAAGGNGTASMPDHDRTVAELLTQCKIFQDYERAFTEMTGLPISFKPAESWHLPHHGRKNEHPLCALIAGKSRSCAVCLQIQQKLASKAAGEPHTLTCPVGLVDTAVPVRLGDRLIGFLQTGHVFRKTPTEEQFSRTAKLIAEWGLQIGQEDLRQMYFNTRLVSPKHYDSVVKLLSIFAQHLSIMSNQILVQQAHAEPPTIVRAKQYIQEHQSEEITLSKVASAVNTSSFYFCKMFRKVTGLNFTDYVSRVRVEKAKNLLLNPNARISEIAFEVGFQSLTHFNRIFKKIVGRSPTEYRALLPRS